MIFLTKSCLCRNQNKQFVFSHHTMLPYFRSMEAFFNLSLPKSWADLSDPQLLFLFRQLATDKPMAEIQTLWLCQWANVLVRCRPMEADFQGVPFSSFISHRQHPLRMGFPRQLRPLQSLLPTHLRHRVLHPPH